MAPTQKGVDETRNEILKAITYTFSIIILPALFMAVRESFDNNSGIGAMVYIIAYIVWLVFGVFLTKKIEYKVRARLILLLVFTVGVFVLVHHGLSGAGLLFLMTFCVMSTALVSLKFGLLSIVLSLVPIILIGMAMVTSQLHFDQEMVWNSTSVIAWITAGTLFVVLSVCMVWTSGILQTRLLFILSELRSSRDKITSQNIELISEIKMRKEIEQQKEKVEKHLLHSQKLESIGTLAGGIAHDFNNILFPILGHTEMVLDDLPQESPFRESMDEIYVSTMRARELVRQILTFSRQESCEFVLMQIQPVIKEALKLIRSTIPKTIGIKQDIKGDFGLIKADPTQIHQIIMNLATNAYHAMEDTGGEIYVQLKALDLGEGDVEAPGIKPGEYVCLTVADTGIGMDKELSEKIFDPFFTTKKLGKGTGMGLSVVHGIVTGMNGFVRVKSRLKMGTKFQIFLPVEKSASLEQPLQTRGPLQGGSGQILLVDDEKSVVLMEEQMLERLGYQVVSYTDSLEALEAFRSNPDKFDLVITDMSMPSMSGDKLAAQLIEISPDIPVLLCTGFSETMSEEKAVSLGIKGFLFKPISMQDLSLKIAEMLDKNIN